MHNFFHYQGRRELLREANSSSAEERKEEEKKKKLCGGKLLDFPFSGRLSAAFGGSIDLPRRYLQLQRGLRLRTKAKKWRLNLSFMFHV